MTAADRVLARCELERPTLVSTDLFDTVLLRDGSTEDERLRQAADRAATRFGLRPRSVHLARREVHAAGYRAVGLERPDGEARLRDMAAAMAVVLRLPPSAVDGLVRAEVEVDAGHLRAHGSLLQVLRQLAEQGTRVVGVSDTWYGEQDVRALLGMVVGAHPLAALYISSEVGVTKHHGGMYQHVARTEAVDPHRVLHLGDNYTVDVVRAREAGWTAEHLPRPGGHRVSKIAGGLQAAIRGWRR